MKRQEDRREALLNWDPVPDADGYTFYSENVGLPSLREAIAEKYESLHQVELDPASEINEGMSSEISSWYWRSSMAFSVDDPSTFVRPFTAVLLMKRSEQSS